VKTSVIAILLAAYVLAAQSREKRITPVDAAQRESFSKSTNVAIVVGVSDYAPDTGLQKLQYANRDAEAVAAELRRQDYKVRLLVDGEATRSRISAAIREAGDVVSRDGTLLFYFSGHGFAPQPGRNFLATFGVTADDLAVDGLSVDDLRQRIQQSPARRKVLFIDACRSEPGKGGGARSFGAFSASSGLRMLLSTQAGRISYENDQLQQGVFTYFLLKALRGEAAGVDGFVTFRDVSDYVSSSVRDWSFERKQTQVPVEVSDEAAGDFLLAKASASPTPRPDPTPVPISSPRLSAPKPASGAAETKVNGKDGLTYVHIPPGKFTMGCSAGDGECYPDEKPAHIVEITKKGFWIGQTPVTQAAYRRVTEQNPSKFKGPDRPVEQVNWEEARSYCQAVGMRLPTEAEWEYAARASSTAARYANLDDIAWYAGNSGSQTHDVAQKEPNVWGLYDMLGNIWQWTADWYDPKYYEERAGRNPRGPESGELRVLRGGSWNFNERSIRVSSRNRLDPGERYVNIGVRCVGE
jgi:formylglycine-generating enzyme required for sulfatase activity